MSDKISRRDRELYPEQFLPLPGEEEGEEKPRRHAERLSDIDTPDAERRGSSRENGERPSRSELRRLLGDTAPKKQNDAAIPEKKGKKQDSATATAMKLVSRDTLTERRLREKLSLKGYPEEEIDEAVEYVKKFGYVDDLRVSQDMLDKLAARCWGRFKICRYLAGKGVERDTVESLDFSGIDFPAYCARLIAKYPPEKKEAMLRAVKNAGYSNDDYRKAVKLLKE